MPFDAPFVLGPFAVDAAGRLAPGDPATAPAFLLRWRGRVVRARLAQLRPAQGALRLHVTLGRVPSTAAHAIALRPRSFGLLRQLPRALPDAWSVQLLPDHRVQLAAEAELDLPITAVGLVARLTQFLLELAPYLDLADEAGIVMPADLATAAAMASDTAIKSVTSPPSE